MKNQITSWLLTIGFSVFVGGSLVSVLAPQPTLALTDDECTTSFLGFPVWYRGLLNADCTIAGPDSSENNGLSNFIWKIVLNIIDIGLRLVGFIAVAFILYGGFQFLTSSGDPTGAANARKTILNAVIGIVISVASVAIVNLIIGNL